MEITNQEGGGRVPPTPQGVVTPTLQGGTPIPTASPGSLSGKTHTQKIVSIFLSISTGFKIISIFFFWIIQ